MLLATLREEKAHWNFLQELRNINEATVKPITPSKIPVGKYRVETDIDISNIDSNRLGEQLDLNRNSRASSPSPGSKIPVGGWRGRTTAYKKILERQESETNLKSSEINEKHSFNSDNPALTNSNRNHALRNGFSSYGSGSNRQGNGITIPSITFNDGGSFRCTSESNHSHLKEIATGTKIPPRFARQRSYSAGPPRTMRHCPNAQE